jgi:hypothetical protein
MTEWAEDWERPFDVRASVRAQIARMNAVRASPEPLMLFVSPVSFDRGEDWVREAFAVGPDVEIVESLPLPLPGEEPREARRYPSAMRKP